MVEAKPTNFKRFSEIATVHGLYRVGHSDGWLQRAAWGLLVTGLVTTVVLLTTNIFIEHFSYPSLTEMEKVTDNRIDFPSVTVCHANNFKLSAFQNAAENMTELIASLVRLSIKRSLDLRKIIPPSQSVVAEEFNKVYLNSTVIKELSATPNALKWNFKDWCTFSITSNCKYPDDFVDYFYSSALGFCKTFNPTKKYTQVAPGLLFGLGLRLFLDESDKMSLINDNGAGVILMVHPQDVYPNPYTDGILVPLGHEAYISLRKLVFKRLKSPYKSNCTDGKGIFLIYPGRYTVLNCQYSCFVKYMMEECGYHETVYQYHKPKEFAESLKIAAKKNFSIDEVMTCLSKITNENSSSTKSCYCPPACYEESILTSTSYTQWPHPSAAEYYRTLVSNFTGKNMSKDQVYQSLLSVRVFFDELGYQRVQEIPRSNMANLFSQTGGQFGLWIGASVFSIIEFIIFIFNSIMFLCKRKINPEIGGSVTRITVNNNAGSSVNLKSFT